MPPATTPFASLLAESFVPEAPLPRVSVPGTSCYSTDRAHDTRLTGFPLTLCLVQWREEPLVDAKRPTRASETELIRRLEADWQVLARSRRLLAGPRLLVHPL